MSDPTTKPEPKPKLPMFFEQARREAASMSQALTSSYPELVGAAVILAWDPRLGNELPSCIISGQGGEQPTAHVTFELLQRMTRVCASLYARLQQTYLELNQASEELAKKLNDQTQHFTRNADDGGANQVPAGEPPAVSDASSSS